MFDRLAEWLGQSGYLGIAALMFLENLFPPIGVTTLARLLRFDPTAEEDHHHFTPRVAMLVLAIVLALVMLHGIEIWLYAGLYLYLDAVADLETPYISRR